MRRLSLENVTALLLLTVFGLIVVHAPISVWFSANFPDISLVVKAWKEVLIAVAVTLVALQLYRQNRWREFIKRPVVALALIYSALHVFMIGLYFQGLLPTIAGLLIDVRYVIYFLAVLGFLTLYPQYRPRFIKIGAVAAVAVVGFATVQVFLPHDFLKILGYSESTIRPYLTVDQNYDFIRHNSTLRGPNPLSAYACMALAGVVAYWLAVRKKLPRLKQLALLAFFAASLVALWVGYSRSAFVAAIVTCGITILIKHAKHIKRRTWLVVSGAVLALLVGIFLARDSAFVQNVVLHRNPAVESSVDSNAAHATSLAHGLERLLVQPLGAGIGSTGSASLLGGGGLIVENQYLMIAHEVGWLGLGLFLLLYGVLMRQLWQRRQDWLAAAAFASGAGLALIGLLLPVWADDTVSIVWWGFAATALIGGLNGQNKANKKAKRTA